MKTPYIINYMEEILLQPSVPLHYDNYTQINYLNDEKSIKAVSFNSGPLTTIRTESIENSDDTPIMLGPESTVVTDTVENSDLNYYGPSTTEKTATVENSDHDNHYLLGPDTTRFTKSNEAVDSDYMLLGPETTRQTATIENSDINTFIFGPDTTQQTFTVEPDDHTDILRLYSPDTTIVTRAVENSDEY